MFSNTTIFFLPVPSSTRDLKELSQVGSTNMFNFKWMIKIKEFYFSDSLKMKGGNSHVTSLYILISNIFIWYDSLNILLENLQLLDSHNQIWPSLIVIN